MCSRPLRKKKKKDLLVTRLTTPYLVYASDPRQKGDLSWKVVQALLEKVERRDGLVQPLVYLRWQRDNVFFFFLIICQLNKKLLQGCCRLPSPGKDTCRPFLGG